MQKQGSLLDLSKSEKQHIIIIAKDY